MMTLHYNWYHVDLCRNRLFSAIKAETTAHSFKSLRAYLTLIIEYYIHPKVSARLNKIYFREKIFY